MKARQSLKVAFFLLLLTPAVWAQSLGTTNLLEGPSAGSDSVVLAASNSWTATANDSWLHLSAPNQSGTHSTNVIFTFDANAGATRTGTLTIAGKTLTVTQAGSTYVAINNDYHTGVFGNEMPHRRGSGRLRQRLYRRHDNSAVKEWVATSNTVITLVSSGLNYPSGVAVDGSGNVYIADT